jgi:hypothetical protein
MPCLTMVSSDTATLHHTRWGLVVGTKLGTASDRGVVQFLGQYPIPRSLPGQTWIVESQAKRPSAGFFVTSADSR